MTMRVTIEIDTDNDAFGEHGDDPQFGTELVQILKTLANVVTNVGHTKIDARDSLKERPIRDTNGNKVGTINLTEEPVPELPNVIKTGQRNSFCDND